MASEPKTLTQAIQYFADADNCLNYLVARRWPNGVQCPTCGRTDVSFVPSRRLWQCKTRHPKTQFSIKTGTILEDSPLGLDKWLPVMWLVANCKNGVSSWEIHRSLGVTQKTAWFMLHRVRLAMKNESAGKLGSEGGPVEADETFVGPNPYKQHRSKRADIKTIANTTGASLHAPGKTIVMGMLDRAMRQVRAMVVPNVKRSTLQEKILNNIEAGATVITDDFPVYRYALADKFAHDVINHVESYVNGQIHTQGIENFWSLLKRTLRGTYVAVEPFHLDRYVDEQAFRFNNRATRENPKNDADRFSLLCSQIVGKRVTYAELTAKDDKKPEVPF
jgi:transposase-like protein